MADERDQWLDKDTAERLLRGEPVETTGAYAGVDAARIAAALRDLARIADANTGGGAGGRGGEAGNGGAPGETRGEVAAVAAFRRARRSRGSAHQDGAARPAAVPAGRRELGRTELARTDGRAGDRAAARRHDGTGTGAGGRGRARPKASRAARHGPAAREATRTADPDRRDRSSLARALFGSAGRPRGGPAATLAGLVLGGAVLALGSGVLVAPATTGGHGGPRAPAPLTEGPLPSASGGPDGSGDLLTSDGPVPDGADFGPWESIGKRMLSLDGATGVAATAGGPGSSGPASPWARADGGASPSVSAARASGAPSARTRSAWYEAAVEACQGLRDGSLDRRRKTTLIRAAKGSRGAAEFCARLLDGRHPHGGHSGDDSSDPRSNPTGGSASPHSSPSGGFGVHDPGGGTSTPHDGSSSQPHDGSTTSAPNDGGTSSAPNDGGASSEPHDGSTSSAPDGSGASPVPDADGGGTSAGPADGQQDGPRSSATQSPTPSPGEPPSTGAPSTGTPTARR